MLVLLRIVLGLALLYEMTEGAQRAPGTGEAGDLTGAAYLAVCVILGILNALVWAPYLGAKVSGPLTVMMTGSTYMEHTNWVLRLLRRFDARHWRRTTLALSFWEAVRHPTSPAPFVTGFKNARPGSWLEKVFAREVFRFNNTQNCVLAYLALKRHGIDPRPHPSQEVNIVLLSLERQPRPEPEILAVPSAEKPAPLHRNPRIRLFKREESDPTKDDRADRQTSGAEPPGPPSTDSSPTTPTQTEASPQPPDSTGWPGLLARIAAFLRAH